ncbi:MAG: hypothetical protein N3A66_08510, partial [Planctomycetota bacterium]|nr:hypothetical protein [Planctomycetota bacterium]
ERRALEQAIIALDHELDRLGKMQQRAQYARLLRHIQSLEECREKLCSLAAFTPEHEAEMSQRERRRGEAQQALALAAERRKQSAAEKQRAEAALAEKQHALSQKKRLAEEAERLRLAISSHRPPPKEMVRWNIILAALAIFGAIAGGAIAWAALPLAAAAAVTAALLIAAGGLIAASRRKEWQPDPQAELSLLAQIRDAWINAGGEASIGALGTVDGVVDFLSRQVAEFRSAEQACRSLEDERKRREDDFRHCEAEERQAAERLRAAEAAFAEWLRAAGASSVAEYAQKRDERKRLEALLAEHEKAVGPEALRDLAKAKSDCLRRLRDFDEAGIPDSVWDEAAYQARKRERAEKEQRKNRAIEEITRLTSEVSQSAGQIGERLASLDKRIVEQQRQKARLEAAIAACDFDRDAAQQAIAIFQGIAAEHRLQFENLSNEISSLLGEALPPRRAVAITDFAEEKCRCEDGVGEMRDVKALSRGMRDTFYFAARLALARGLLPERAAEVLAALAPRGRLAPVAGELELRPGESPRFR